MLFIFITVLIISIIFWIFVFKKLNEAIDAQEYIVKLNLEIIELLKEKQEK